MKMNRYIAIDKKGNRYYFYETSLLRAKEWANKNFIQENKPYEIFRVPVLKKAG